ncbi:hypothetical protein RHMOL_Rhmol13G0019700 [Rhododendron molle]|uniref:Uncharacterized protein n=1 Tax=Rhododendron molle TaxID=49168 RepID=A0ACC0L1Y8_RHOML|nr:hypothetical protein RHMOL_Rhmol13G0019700 [Rhododendron molle]
MNNISQFHISFPHVGYPHKLLLVHPKRSIFDQHSNRILSSPFCEITVSPIPTSPDLLKDALRCCHLIPKTFFCQNLNFSSPLALPLLTLQRQVGRSLKYSPRLFTTNLEKHIVPKIATLRELNVPASTLSVLVTYTASVLLQNSKKFDKTVKEVVEMAPKPLNVTFVQLLKMMLGLSNSTWEHKMEVFRKCGWSEDDLQLALKKFPLCMSVSEKKITSAMDFLVNEMGWKPAAIAKVPSVLLFSLKRRTIPRCLVLKVLMLKGLILKDVCLSTVLMKNDKYFLDRFVTKYAQDVPQLLDVFNGKVSLAELGLKTEETCGRKTIVASQLHLL